MKNYPWGHQAMQAAHQVMMADMIGHPDGIIKVDSSEFLKIRQRVRRLIAQSGQLCWKPIILAERSKKSYYR
jgi:hypothetical protein